MKRFTLGGSSPAWDGVDTGQTWNGWSCPLFPRRSAEQIAAWLSESDDGWPSDPVAIRWEGDRLVITNPNGEVEVDSTPDEDGLYNIGSGGWVWTPAESGPQREAGA